ncbi:MAG: RHS repeat-associated core domain-containing protein [Blastocatellia bacterium]|nr:RHS repeat-associated core domain-containing protein [Blastocatellia bacterium]
MFDKLHSYPKYFIFFTVISLLFALPTFANSTKPKTRKTKQSKNQSLKITEPKEYKRVYEIWKQYYLALEKGENPPKPLPTGYNFTSDEEIDKISTIWHMASYDAYRYLNLKKEQETKQIQQTKTLNKFDVNVAYKIWKDYYLAQEQGISSPPPNFQPLNADEQETNRLIAIWNKGKEKAHKETLKRREDARTGKLSFQAKPVTPLVSDPLLPVQTIPTSNALAHIIRKPKGMAGISTFTANPIPQPNQIQTIQNAQNNIIINANNSVNRSIAEQNKENISYNVAKAKELANIAYPLIDNPGVTTQYLTDTNNVTGLPQVVEELQNGQVVRQYSYGADGLISMRQLINNEWVVSFFIKDGHGSVRMLTDVNGNITDTYDYDAFGNLVAKTGNTPNNRLYAGEEFDEDLGFYYLRARFLDTVKGRFITQDTFEGITEEPISLHKYIYAESDPTNNHDPFGLAAISTINSSFLINQTLLSSATLQPSYFTSQQSTNSLPQPRPTLRGQVCDIILGSLFGGPGAQAAANGFETLDGRYREHLDPNAERIMHLYGNKETTAITTVFLPSNGFLIDKISDTEATYRFYYNTLRDRQNVYLQASHIQSFLLEKQIQAQKALKKKNPRLSIQIPIESASVVRNAAGFVFIGLTGGPGGEANRNGKEVHSHFIIGNNLVRRSRTYYGDLSFPQVFCGHKSSKFNLNNIPDSNDDPEQR